MNRKAITFFLCTLSVFSANYYSHSSANYTNQTWMTDLDDGVPLRQLTIVGTHSSMSQGTWGDAFQTQSSSLETQLKSGVRALDIRCNHNNNKFQIHERSVDLNIDLPGVLTKIQTFLQAFPGETVLVHII
jgi:1-phosphatidylinositol phosphodiesterase